MSFSNKRRLVCLLLLGVALWPLVQRGLVAKFDVSPWRLFGWAMYCVPILSVEISVVPERDGQPMQLALAAESQRDATRFSERRLALGRLADPSALAARVLERQPAAHSVTLVIQHNRLDPSSAMIRGTREYYRYSRAPDRADAARGGRFAIRELP